MSASNPLSFRRPASLVIPDWAVKTSELIIIIIISVYKTNGEGQYTLGLNKT